MTGCALHIFAVGQYNPQCCQTFDNISLQDSAEQKSCQRHLQISPAIHFHRELSLDEGQPITPIGILRVVGHRHDCVISMRIIITSSAASLLQPFAALTSSVRNSASRTVSYAVIGDDWPSTSGIPFNTTATYNHLHNYRSSCLVFDSV